MEIEKKVEYHQFDDDKIFKITKIGEKKKNKSFKFNIFNCHQIILLCFQKTENGKIIKLNLLDLQLLQWFYDFQNTNKMTKIINPEDNKTYCWVNYKAIVEEFPFLDLKKQGVYLSFKKLSNFKILEHYTHKMGGTFSCYRINEQIFDCLFYENNKNLDDLVRNIDTLHKILLTPTYNFIDPLHKILLNKILYYYNNYTIKESLFTKVNNSVSDEEDFSDEKSHHQENTDKYNSLKEKQKKHSNKLNKNNTPKNKYILNKDQKNKIIPILEIWNKNKNTSNHSVNRNSKVIYNIYNYIESLMNGNFIKEYNIPSKFLTEIKADKSELKKGLSLDRIINGINNYLLEFETGYYPFTKKEKNKLPKSLETILFNLYNGCISIFLKVLYSPPKFVDDMVSFKKDNYPDITKMYLEKFLEKNENELSILEKNKLVNIVNEIIIEYKDIISNKIKVNNKNIKRYEIENSNFAVNMGSDENNPFSFISNHIEYLNMQKKYNDKFVIDINRIKVNGYWWVMFEKWYKKTFNITFFPDKEYLKMKAENLLNVF